MAEGLPEDGKLLCLEYNQKFVDIAIPFWKEGGVDKKIEVVIGDAKASLQALLNDQSNHNSFDFGYVDADKNQNDFYVKSLIDLIKPGGFIMIDNVLWLGNVSDP
mmetsp:Transcript_15679/g.15164  ORF Transcript_15679/g.15164 Transcript_15679/m.15164 type:complete len:105 (+) Transcript_15679:235-549(+)|eukprot:CAMPEP_0170559384 /NCGR_PEP_ID=MMETSP0211-20121228/42349_1 /TAXON_ID=311385 /ORGANISM="Pseudokeronopsis sp., Strain OXSARD2" /LENGTH=104 /DNA_ID=CAMNT_0010872345 /DNA_START=202 /DNA_END=516 /DNA_ORIENTATION=+